RLDGAVQPGGAVRPGGGAQPGGQTRPGDAQPAGGEAAPSACSGAITFSAEGGSPAATSGQFPAGTRLRVTNLDNNKAVTVTVTGPSGSCVLLNAAAMDLVREPGKNVIRRNVVEVLG
ncbi:hypothetical protein DKL51_22430, partial [Micromonospora globispora]